MKPRVAEDIRHIFNAPNRAEADRLLKLTVEKYAKSAPQLSAWMEINIPRRTGDISLQWHYLKLRHALRSIYHGFSLIWFLQLFVVSASLEMASIAA